jgi:hypothetical protein
MFRISLILTFLTLPVLAADPSTLAKLAARGDANAIRQLRAMGQPGVDALMAVRANTLAFEAAIDAVCKQRDCAWSGLYWHTDLEAAKRVAKQTRKPILSLRLLGNLDEELSCANSRYFRTLLYPNRDIRAFLRANYVLHWQRVRPAAVITIDFGDGRRMRRTITGNSIHYVLDEHGAALDAIPGLYAPPVFLTLLREGAALHREINRIPDPQRRFDAVVDYHSNALTAKRRKSISPTSPANEVAGTRQKRLAAWTSGNLAQTKGGPESTMFDTISFGARAQGAMQDFSATIRGAVTGPKTIDDNAVALIRTKRASSPDPLVRSKKSLEQTLKTLESSLAADTKTNEERLHKKLHEWFANEEVKSVDALNERVYDELFLAPNSDPWMGLMSEAVFTGLIAEGLIVTR